MDFRLAGQVIAAPRWQNVGHRAGDREGHLTTITTSPFWWVWDDPFKDAVHLDDADSGAGRR